MCILSNTEHPGEAIRQQHLARPTIVQVLRFSENGTSVQFRIGEKQYDLKAVICLQKLDTNGGAYFYGENGTKKQEVLGRI